MRALVFAHFDPHGQVDDHVLYALRCYRPYFDVISFISTADLSYKDILAVKLLADTVVKRDNVGYDFLSWRIGFDGLPVSSFDEIVFANDSCYGPCYDIGQIFETARSSPADLWGVTVNRQFRPHVQSFFMSFRKSLLSSGFASHFWSTVDAAIPDKMELILRHEVGLSAAVEAAGFTVGGLIDVFEPEIKVRYRVIDDNLPFEDDPRWPNAKAYILTADAPNPVQLYWGEALRLGCPFVKVEILRDNPLAINRKNVIAHLRNSRWFEVGLIERHLERVAPRSWSAVF
ncbi:rhamnan synthesis F family protein [Methylobacterium oryzisoli]|uniref:rhamnan synthesis F family protein n=1 Tax=Methylobacterium oryzisoli TaxID=3385502 RepID=UPI0038915CFC